MFEKFNFFLTLFSKYFFLKKPSIAVVKGKPTVVNPNMVLKKQTDEDKKLSEMRIPKKHKRLYNKNMYSQKKTRQEVFNFFHPFFN